MCTIRVLKPEEIDAYIKMQLRGGSRSLLGLELFSDEDYPPRTNKISILRREFSVIIIT
jgi:hypothetical protein